MESYSLATDFVIHFVGLEPPNLFSRAVPFLIFKLRPGLWMIVSALGSKLRMRIWNITARGNMADDAGKCRILEIHALSPA